MFCKVITFILWQKEKKKMGTQFEVWIDELKTRLCCPFSFWKDTVLKKEQHLAERLQSTETTAYAFFSNSRGHRGSDLF